MFELASVLNPPWESPESLIFTVVQVQRDARRLHEGVANGE